MTTDRSRSCRRCGQPENRHFRSHAFEPPRLAQRLLVNIAPAELVVKADTPQPCCLRAMRVDAGLLLRDMAEWTERAPAEICDWEFGRAVPSPADVLAMSSARQAGRGMARTDAATAIARAVKLADERDAAVERAERAEAALEAYLDERGGR